MTTCDEYFELYTCVQSHYDQMMYLHYYRKSITCSVSTQVEGFYMVSCPDIECRSVLFTWLKRRRAQLYSHSSCVFVYSEKVSLHGEDEEPARVLRYSRF
ncbi:hypothetical protein Y032_0228g2891 [Ancylostoma ceylanicum]|uniref:Uncharacterized protein n=1 Tax=Ancylostoma ceylanicum TaxID=53326 RepID=A0A016SGM8_9BILA|nr:hypothetical protein Y032_0228g2891 [Ancylostoma ceylanicum]